MLFWDAGKAPEEVAPYDIDWSLRLGAETIVSSDWEIVGGDSPAAGTLVLGAKTNTTTRAQIVLSAGNLGVTYTLKNTVMTSGGGLPLIELIQLPVRYPTYAGSLATVADALQWLGQTSDTDGKIARLLSGVSTQIQNFLSYNVAKSSYTRTLDGEGTRQLFLPERPLVSVETLTIDGLSIPKGVMSGGVQRPGFYNNANAILLVGYGFTRGFQNISATYTAGYDPIPADIVQAALEWTKMLWTMGAMPFPSNVVKVAAGDTSFDFGDAGGSATDARKIPIPTSIYSIIAIYRRVVGVSGI